MDDQRIIAAQKQYHDAWGDWPRREAANDALMLVERCILQEQFVADMKELERVGYRYGAFDRSRTQSIAR